MDDYDLYFSGQKLYGDDFELTQIADWARDEAEGYANLGAKVRGRYVYPYHAMNMVHGYRHIALDPVNRVLGIGAAWGDEFIPIGDKVREIAILDPSSAFSEKSKIGGAAVTRHKPEVDNSLPFKNGEFDLITCFGAMHHIPNVSHVFSECSRCLRINGIMLIREPIVSMGDWRQPRPGLTRHERGIPSNIFRTIVIEAGFQIVHEQYCRFPVIPILARFLGLSAYNNYLLTRLDGILSELFRWNIKYHRLTFRDKLGPAAVFYVLRKG